MQSTYVEEQLIGSTDFKILKKGFLKKFFETASLSEVVAMENSTWQRCS